MLDSHLSSCKTKKKKESTSVLTCHICNKKCLSERSLKRHGYDNHGKFNCPECGEVFSSRIKFNRHKMKTHRNSTFPCSQCEKSFSEKSDLIRHVKTIHQRIQDFICSLCGKRFNQIGNLRRHISTVHDLVKRYKCTICDQRFGHSSHRITHMKTVHDRIKYRYLQCEYEATQKSHLYSHINSVHLRKYPFNCKYCDHGCTHSKHLESHVKSKHPKHWNLEQKDYDRNHPEECSKCKKKFMTTIELQRHFNNLHNHSIGLALNKQI